MRKNGCAVRDSHPVSYGDEKKQENEENRTLSDFSSLMGMKNKHEQ